VENEMRCSSGSLDFTVCPWNVERRTRLNRDRTRETPGHGAILAEQSEKEPGNRPSMQKLAYSFALDLRFAKIQRPRLLVFTALLSFGISGRDAFRHS
jgi:hypothetical protein